MSEWNGFGGLDLTAVENSGGGSMRLPVGKYTAKCTDAKIESISGTNNKKLVLSFEDEGGLGDIRQNLNIHHKSQQAQEIALRQLKSFLIASGHPNPDKPDDVQSLIGLRCQIVVGDGKPYTNKDGQNVQYTEIKYFNPVDGVVTDSANTKETPEKLDDDIPF